MMNGDHHHSSEPRPISPGIASLANLGNTCFLNSVLYTLRFTPGFCHSLHHLHQDLQKKWKLENGRRGPGQPQQDQQIEVIHTLHHLFQKLCSTDCCNGDPKDPVLPSSLLQSIRRLITRFEGNQQQDAHELLVNLLTYIQDAKLSPSGSLEPSRPDSQCSFSSSDSAGTDKKASKKTKVISNGSSTHGNSNSASPYGGQNEDMLPLLPPMHTAQNGIDKAMAGLSTAADKSHLNHNFVTENLVGIEVTRTKCLECESSTFKKEEFTNIGIPILHEEEEDDGSFNFYMNRILASETFRDVNKYWCSECSRLNEAQHTVSYEVLPSILILQHKRFIMTVAGLRKLTNYVPTPLLMDCFCQKCREGPGPPLHQYKLYSVILHLGASMESGHYIACVRAADINQDYFQCNRPGPVDTAVRNKQQKRGIFKMFTKSSAAATLPPDPPVSLNGGGNPVCGSISCCGLRLNLPQLEEKVSANHSTSSINGCNGSRSSPGSIKSTPEQEDIWLECDDEQISVMTRQQLEDILTSRQSTKTPYVMFYNRVR